MRCSVMALLCLFACGDSGGGMTGDDSPGGEAGTGCAEAWTCTPWQTDGQSDTGTRTCTDANACGTTVMKPVETAVLPALDAAKYECDVEPIVIRNCSMLGCHGTETGRAYRLYARGRLRITGRTITEPGCLSAGTVSASETCIGGIECKCWTVPQIAEERRRSFDSARGFALDGAGQPLADIAQSELLAQPLVGGGFAHAGMSMWSATDADYATVKAWLSGQTRGSACNSQN